jgi:hypothetical protein
MNEELKRKIHEMVEVRYVQVSCYPGLPAERYVIFVCGIPCLIGAANTPVDALAEQIRCGLVSEISALDGLPTSADLDADAQERRIAEETK